MADRFARAEKRAPQIYPDHAVKVRHIEFIARRGLLNPGIVDQDVQRSKLFNYAREHVFHLLFVSHIGFYRQGLALLILLGYFSLHGLRPIRAAVVIDRDISAFLREADCNRLAYSRGGARDERILS